MAQKAISEHGQALLDALAQMLANSPTLLDRMRIVLLEQAVAGILDTARQPSAMEQSKERGEVLEPLLLKHARQVELDVSLATNERAVAEESQAQAVGDDAPKVLGAIEVILHQRMRRHAWPPRGRHPPQLLSCPHQVNRRRLGSLAGPVRDREREPVPLVGLRDRPQLVSEEPKERHQPGVGRDLGGQVVGREPLQAMLEDTPEGAGVGESRGDLVGQVSLRRQTEIGRAWPGSSPAKSWSSRSGPSSPPSIRTDG